MIIKIFIMNDEEWVVFFLLWQMKRTDWLTD